MLGAGVLQRYPPQSHVSPGGVDEPAGPATYDRRRLRLKGLIEPIAHTNRYRITDRRRIATSFTRRTRHVVIPALGALRDTSRPNRRIPLPWRNYDRRSSFE